MQSSVPALTPQHPTDSSSRAATGGSRKVQEQVGSYIKKLVGDEAGDGMLHWRLVNEMDAIDGLIQDNLERDRAAEQKALQRTVLEEQVREARKKDHDFKSSRMHWGSKIQADAAQWQEEERLKKIRQQETLRKFNEEQARHAEASRRRKDAEAQEVAQLEHAMAQQAADAKRQQELAEEQRRKKQQEMAKQMADAAKEAAEQKVLRKQEEAEKDIAMMKAQIAVMEAQEQQRAQSFQRMKEKQGKAQAQYEARCAKTGCLWKNRDHSNIATAKKTRCDLLQVLVLSLGCGKCGKGRDEARPSRPTPASLSRFLRPRPAASRRGSRRRPTFTDYLETMTYLMLDLQDIMNTLFSTCFWQSESV
ncbi:unnamed protein product [Durusdinium trenchii]|uniref:Uncharacterized protein n=1 Tax=Durusdinium trenchii TaxID=1381693 RepID=A0ABP0PUS0_9DINO